MFPHPHTCTRVIEAERQLALRRAEQVGPLVAAARQSRPETVVVVGSPVAPLGRLLRAVRSLRWVLRPSHA